jgi:hypothetical protein
MIEVRRNQRELMTDWKRTSDSCMRFCGRILASTKRGSEFRQAMGEEKREGKGRERG